MLRRLCNQSSLQAQSFVSRFGVEMADLRVVQCKQSDGMLNLEQSTAVQKVCVDVMRRFGCESTEVSLKSPLVAW
jgi:hypothetical protein